MNNTYRSQVLPLVKAYNADRDMVKNMVIIMTRVSETDLLPHLLWTPIIIYKKELEEMSEMPDDDCKYMLMMMVTRMAMVMLMRTPMIINRKELEEMSEMLDDDYKYVDGDEDGDGDVNEDTNDHLQERA